MKNVCWFFGMTFLVAISTASMLWADFVRQHCVTIADNAANRDYFCTEPEEACQIIGTPCMIGGNQYVALSRANFVSFEYERCENTENNFKCVQEVDQLTSAPIETICLSWMAYSDLSCNNLLCLGRHRMQNCETVPQ